MITVIQNNPGTAKVGTPPKAQKEQKDFNLKSLKARKIPFLKNSQFHGTKKTQSEAILGLKRFFAFIFTSSLEVSITSDICLKNSNIL